MLRRTAARAFGGGRTDSSVPRPRHHTDLIAAAERLFAELQASLKDAIDRLESGPTRPHVTPPRTLARGVEFVLVGTHCCCRFLSHMDGFVIVTTLHSAEDSEDRGLRAEDQVVAEDVLFLQYDCGAYRPALKPLSTDRGGFSLSSASELARYYLDAVC